MPVREQLGNLLLKLKRPHDAMKDFVAELKITPARFRALYGAAIAAERNGREVSAQKYFAQLVKQAAGGDASRSELVHARGYLKRSLSVANRNGKETNSRLTGTIEE
jgi:hypothetical protein